MRPTTLSLGGQGTPRGLAEIWVVGAHMWEESSLDSHSPMGRFPFGRRSPRGTPPAPIAPQGPPGHLYNEGRGWGRNTSNPKAYVPPSLPLNPVAPQLDPGLDVVLNRNPLGFSPSSFLGGVLLWTAERCWIAATGCVDTGRGSITLILLRGASSSSRRSVRGTCSWDRSRDCSWDILGS